MMGKAPETFHSLSVMRIVNTLFGAMDHLQIVIFIFLTIICCGLWTLDAAANTTQPIDVMETTSSKEDFGTADTSAEEIVEIEESNVIEALTREGNFNGTNTTLPGPFQMDLSFVLQGDNVTLKMQRNDHIRSNTQVVLGEDDKLSLWAPLREQDFTVYSDPALGASIILKLGKDPAGKIMHEYSGSFMLGPDEYAVEPVTSLTPTGRRRRRRNGNTGPGQGRVKHVIYKREPMAMENGYETVPLPAGVNRQIFKERDSKFPQFAERKMKPFYSLEMLIVTDYTIYRRWYALSEGDNVETRKNNAIGAMKMYYAHVANGVDMRYSTLDNEEYSLHIRLVGLYIATDMDASPFSRDNREAGSPRGSLRGDPALISLSAWLYRNSHVLPKHDQATMFTRDYLIGLSGTTILGMSIPRTICTMYALSVNRDPGHFFGAIQTAAHEIAHNLGANHDGDGNSCLTSDQYIMAAQPFPLTGDRFKNALTFSVCSKNDIGNYIKNVANSENNCLLERTNRLTSFDELTAQLPGQLFSLNEQCQQMYGNRSFYCGGATEDTSICRHMECLNPEVGHCFATLEQRAADGSTCGNKKWCFEGGCVYDERAPEAQDYCTHGDFKGGYEEGLTCRALAVTQPWRCYLDFYYDDCCSSCPMIKDESKPGCEYGDKGDNCTSISTNDCLEQNINTVCCSTCQNITPCSTRRDPSWCSSYIRKSDDCYNYGSDCCRTCGPYKTGHAGCEFGDRKRSRCTREDCLTENKKQLCCKTCAEYDQIDGITLSPTHGTTIEACEDTVDWCNEIKSTSCYRDTKPCCKTCQGFYLGEAGCEYGDHYSWCKPQYCQTPSLRRECCVTCRWMLEQSGAAASSSSNATTAVKVTNGVESVCTSSDPSPFCDTLPARGCYLFSDICCNRCAARKYVGHVGCEYGDRVGRCPDTLSGPEDCLKPDIARDCCWTCQLYAPGSAACQDNAGWCTDVTALDCYKVEDVCCRTCQQHRQDTQGCAYGDKSTWCSRYIQRVPSVCEDANIRRQCCFSCKGQGASEGQLITR